jgi:hypothetical protein
MDDHQYFNSIPRSLRCVFALLQLLSSAKSFRSLESFVQALEPSTSAPSHRSDYKNCDLSLDSIFSIQICTAVRTRVKLLATCLLQDRQHGISNRGSPSSVRLWVCKASESVRALASVNRIQGHVTAEESTTCLQQQQRQQQQHCPTSPPPATSSNLTAV